MQAIAISAEDLKKRGNAVFEVLNDQDFLKLNDWKQAGFYSQPLENRFITPNEAVMGEIAETVFMLAWRATTTLDFLLKDGNLVRYIDVARELRAKMSAEQLAAMTAAGEELANQLFPIDLENVGDHALH